jgi:hypothetical protein
MCRPMPFAYDVRVTRPGVCSESLKSVPSYLPLLIWLHLQMHFLLPGTAPLRPWAAVLAAIGRMLLTSAIMKSQAPIRYTEYPDMFG